MFDFIKKHLYQFVLLGFIAYAFYYGMGSYAILDMNEGLYAEIAREMAATHQYIIPHLNGVPYIEKPPLLYWLIALSYHAFGVTESAARFIPSTAGFLVCLSLVLFQKSRDDEQSGWLAALILSSSIVFIIIARTVFFDMLLTLWVTAGLLLFYRWYETERKLYLRCAYASLALGFLTKGLIAIGVPGLIAVLFLALMRTPGRRWLQFFDPVGILGFFAIVLPWHIIAVLTQPGFAWDYFINEQWYRLLDKREPHDYHTGPWYFYLPRLLGYLFPWTLFIPALFKQPKAWAMRKNPLQTFLWLAFLVPLFVYSFSRAKGDYYMVLGMPPLALLIALKLEVWMLQNYTKLLKVVFGMVGLFILVTLSVIVYANYTVLPVGHFLSELALSPALKSQVLMVFVTFVIYIGISSLFCLSKRANAWVLILALAGLVIPLVSAYIKIRHVSENDYSQVAVARFMQENPTKTLYLYRDFEELSSLLFYYQKRIPIIESRSRDLYYGEHTPQAQGGFIDMQTFLNQHKASGYIVLKASWLPQLTDSRSYNIIFKNDDTLVIELK